MKRDGLACQSWGTGSSAPREVRHREAFLEQSVSKTIGEMSFLWLSVNDDPGPNSLRGYVKRNAFSLLSNYKTSALDPPSVDWLGRYCGRERVGLSGLWNQNHVDEQYDPAFLDTLACLIRKAEEGA